MEPLPVATTLSPRRTRGRVRAVNTATEHLQNGYINKTRPVKLVIGFPLDYESTGSKKPDDRFRILLVLWRTSWYGQKLGLEGSHGRRTSSSYVE